MASVQLCITTEAGRDAPPGTGHFKSRGGRLIQPLPSKTPTGQRYVGMIISTGLCHK